MNFQPLAVAKFVASAVVMSGTTKIVHSIISRNTTPEKITDTVTIAAASWAIGGMMAEKTKEYTDKTIDDIAEFYHENVKPKFQK